MISLPVWPMRPTKLRLVVETARSPSASTPQKPPRHGPQVGMVKMAPASMKISTRPSERQVLTTCCVPGMTMQRTRSLTLWPLRIWAAMRMSLMRPFVQLPMTTWSMARSLHSLAGLVFSGRCGSATVRSSWLRSMVTTLLYSASSSGSKAVYSRVTRSAR